jgi:outer membrane protein assembly factor BamB
MRLINSRLAITSSQLKVCSLALVTLLTLGGCSWFGGDEEEIVPAKLVKFDAEVKLVTLWDHNLGKGANDSAIKLMPAFSGSRIYAASADGNVFAIDSANGNVLWEVNVVDYYSEEERGVAFADDIDVITGGVGQGSNVVVVGSAAGELVALSTEDGALLWKAKTTSEVLAPPQVDNELVVAQAIDGKVAAYNISDGERLWIYSTSIPSLTLRGTSTPIVTDEFVIAAFANGRLSVLDRARGLAAIDQRVGISKGKSDLERLVDIDGAMVIEGDNLYATSYQGNMVMLDLSASGRVLWGMEASSVAGLGSGFGNVYLAGADSKLTAISMDSKRELWAIESLLNREITTPLTLSSYIAVGDFEGYIHIIAQSDGRFVARKKIDGAGVSSPVVVDGSRFYVITDGGRLFAMEVRS